MITQTDTEASARSDLTWLKKLGIAVVDLLFPPHCVACRRYGAWLCTDCLDKIEVIAPPICSRCGVPLGAARASRFAPAQLAAPPDAVSVQDAIFTCRGCQHAVPVLNGLRAYAFHSGPLRLAIHQFKYEDLWALAVPLGKLMGQGWGNLAPDHCEIDAIVPVPLHPARQQERGYNQATLLAIELSACLGYPVAVDVLIRTKATAPQVGLSADERRANVHRAFRCMKDSLVGKSVLLVDDVYTTGSTMEAACVALRDGGARSVWAYTLARAGRRK